MIFEPGQTFVIIEDGAIELAYIKSILKKSLFLDLFTFSPNYINRTVRTITIYGPVDHDQFYPIDSRVFFEVQSLFQEGISKAKQLIENYQETKEPPTPGMVFRFDCDDFSTDLYLVKNLMSDLVFETEQREINEYSLTKSIGSTTYEFDEDETFKVIPSRNFKEILKIYRYVFYKIEDTILTALENSWMKEEDN
jgi:hypothetical protein